MEIIDVLFVDDEPDVLETMRMILVMNGVTVCCAMSGEEGLKSINEKRFSVIFTDLVMNGMSGIEFSRIARRMLPDIPIYLLTGLISSPELESHAEVAGISRILTKPVGMDVLLDIVDGELLKPVAKKL